MKIQSEEIYFLKEQVADLQNRLGSRPSNFVTERTLEMFQREIRNEIENLTLQVRRSINGAASRTLGHDQASFEGLKYQNEVSRDLTAQ